MKLSTQHTNYTTEISFPENVDMPVSMSSHQYLSSDYRLQIYQMVKILDNFLLFIRVLIEGRSPFSEN